MAVACVRACSPCVGRVTAASSGGAGGVAVCALFLLRVSAPSHAAAGQPGLQEVELRAVGGEDGPRVRRTGWDSTGRRPGAQALSR